MLLQTRGFLLHTPPASLHVQPWFAQLRVVLVRPRNPLNIGAAARAMSNFGFTEMRLVQPWEPSYLGAKSAVGAASVLDSAKVFASVPEAVADCALVVGTTAVGERELQHPLHVLETAAAHMRQATHSAPVALLFGSEKSGLSNEELSYCHWLLRIPTREQHISMNLGQAVAICLYELARGDAEAGAATPLLPASHEELERITQLLFENLCASDYVQPRGEEVNLDKVRRMVRRLQIPHNDAVSLQGMLRKVLWKLTHSTKPQP